MIQVIYEGTPASFPVQLFNASAPIYWEAGAFAMLDTSGNAVISDGVTGVVGLFADRRNTTVNISNATFLPSNVGIYGDETFFNQPGYGNDLYGTTGGVNNVIPANAIPTTTLLRDETAQNPNTSSRKVTVYIRGGQYQTDQYDATKNYTGGALLYVNTNGVLTTSSNALGAVAKCTGPLNGYNLLPFQLTLV